MAIIHPIDAQIETGLRKMLRAYDGLLSLREKVSPAEIALSDQWQAALEPVLSDLYWYPFRNGFSQVPDTSEGLRKWLQQRYQDEAATRPLRDLLQRYMRRAANLGGGIALAQLGIAGTFRLVDPDYLAMLDEYATTLTTQGTETSLIDTTIDNLVSGIMRANTELTRSLADGISGAVGALIRGWSFVRSSVIAITETTRSISEMMTETFARNFVTYQFFVTREDAIVCKLCAPLHGERMEVNNIPAYLQIPIHANCRCTYRPDAMDWTQPGEVWIGGDDYANSLLPVSPHRAEVIANNQPTIKQVASELGITPGQAVQRAKQNFVREVMDSPLEIHLGGERLNLLAQDGRYKNLFDIAGANEQSVSDYRQIQALWGIGAASAAAFRPTYALVNSHDSASSAADMYGESRIILNESIKIRATYAPNDSYADGLDRTVIPAKLNAIDESFFGSSLSSWVNTNNKNILYRRVLYPEAQIYGGVTLADIAEIALTAADARLLTESAYQILKDAGIRLTIDGDEVKSYDELRSVPHVRAAGRKATTVVMQSTLEPGWELAKDSGDKSDNPLITVLKDGEVLSSKRVTLYGYLGINPYFEEV